MAKTKFVIVGGVAGGATAAARMRRLSEEAEIVLFEKGEYSSRHPRHSANASTSMSAPTARSQPSIQSSDR